MKIKRTQNMKIKKNEKMKNAVMMIKRLQIWQSGTHEEKK